VAREKAVSFSYLDKKANAPPNHSSDVGLLLNEDIENLSVLIYCPKYAVKVRRCSCLRFFVHELRCQRCFEQVINPFDVLKGITSQLYAFFIIVSQGGIELLKRRTFSYNLFT
jgi:hypothetical protein